MTGASSACKADRIVPGELKGGFCLEQRPQKVLAHLSSFNYITYLGLEASRLGRSVRFGEAQ